MSHLASAESKGLFRTKVRERGSAPDNSSDTQASVHSALTHEETGFGFAMLPGMHHTDLSVVNLPNRRRV